MHEAGKITNRYKALDPGKITYTFALGSKKLYDFIDCNARITSYNVCYTKLLRHFRRRFGYPEEQPRRHPQWLKIPAPAGDAAAQVEKLVSGLDLGTVCQSAQCPRITSYNVCYTKLLRDVCQRTLRRPEPGRSRRHFQFVGRTDHLASL